MHRDVFVLGPLGVTSNDGMVDGRPLLNNDVAVDFRRHSAQGLDSIDTGDQ